MCDKVFLEKREDMEQLIRIKLDMLNSGMPQKEFHELKNEIMELIDALA